MVTAVQGCIYVIWECVSPVEHSGGDNLAILSPPIHEYGIYLSTNLGLLVSFQQCFVVFVVKVFMQFISKYCLLSNSIVDSI